MPRLGLDLEAGAAFSTVEEETVTVSPWQWDSTALGRWCFAVGRVRL